MQHKNYANAKSKLLHFTRINTVKQNKCSKFQWSPHCFHLKPKPNPIPHLRHPLCIWQQIKTMPGATVKSLRLYFPVEERTQPQRYYLLHRHNCASHTTKIPKSKITGHGLGDICWKLENPKSSQQTSSYPPLILGFCFRHLISSRHINGKLMWSSTEETKHSLQALVRTIWKYSEFCIVRFNKSSSVVGWVFML